MNVIDIPVCSAVPLERRFENSQRKKESPLRSCAFTDTMTEMNSQPPPPSLFWALAALFANRLTACGFVAAFKSADGARIFLKPTGHITPTRRFVVRLSFPLLCLWFYQTDKQTDTRVCAGAWGSVRSCFISPICAAYATLTQVLSGQTATSPNEPVWC